MASTIMKEQTIVGNIGAIYDKRTVGKDNQSVIDFTVAVTPRKFNPDTKEWEDGKPYWQPVTAWNRLADNIEKSLKKGDRVIVIGESSTQEEATYTVKDESGNDVTKTRPAKQICIANFVGLEISYCTAESHKKSNDSSESNSSKKETSTKPVAEKKAAPAKSSKPKVEEDDDDLDSFLQDLDDDDDDNEVATSSSDDDDEIAF